MIKTTRTLGLTLLMLSLLASSLQAQVKTISSQSFFFHLEKDTTGPSVNIQEKEGKSIFTVYDRSGIDHIWLNGIPLAHDQDSVYAIEKEITANETYLVEAVDRKGNKSSDRFITNQDGLLVRGVQPVTQDQSFYSLVQASYHALLIGVENYADHLIVPLENPIDDADKLKTILTEQYTFDPEKVIVLKDPTKMEIERAFDVLIDSLGDQDNLLIFFAGHGYWDDQAETGFWLPADAKKDRRSTYVRNSTIRDYVKEIDSRHTLLIADACFGGSILKNRGTGHEEIKPYNSLYSMKSRKAMTSGNLQNVPDKSIFMKRLLEQLADNTSDYLAATNLFDGILVDVIRDTHQLSPSTKPNIPQYGVIQEAEDKGGDFIFVRRQTETTMESSK